MSRSYQIALVIAMTIQLSLQADKDSTRTRQYLAVPVLFKTPEMGFAYGISGSVSFKSTYAGDPETRTSLIQAICFFTTREQNVQAFDALIFSPREKYIFQLSSSHSYFPDRFWGLGPNTRNGDMDRYVFEQFFAMPHIKRKIIGKLYGGILYEFQHVYNISYHKGGVFDTSRFAGKTPYSVSGPGASITYDNRDNIFWPTKGGYLYTQMTDFRHELGSNYDLVKWIADLRYFHKLTSKQVIAMQFYNLQTFGNVTPLRELASIGGPNNMRGFYQGRFRSRKMMSFITEYRLIVYKRFGLCVFGGVGNAFRVINEISPRNIKYSYGAGIRFALLPADRLNLRVDYGYADRANHGIYVTVGECF